MNRRMSLLNFYKYANDPQRANTVAELSRRGILKQNTSTMLSINNIYNSTLQFDSGKDFKNNVTNKYAIQIGEKSNNFNWFTINPFNFAAADDGSAEFKFNTDAVVREFLTQYTGKLMTERDDNNREQVKGHEKNIAAIDKKLKDFKW